MAYNGATLPDGRRHLGGNHTARPPGNARSLVQSPAINLPSQTVKLVWATAQAWFPFC